MRRHGPESKLQVPTQESFQPSPQRVKLRQRDTQMLPGLAPQAGQKLSAGTDHAGLTNDENIVKISPICCILDSTQLHQPFPENTPRMSARREQPLQTNIDMLLVYMCWYDLMTFLVYMKQNSTVEQEQRNLPLVPCSNSSRFTNPDLNPKCISNFISSIPITLSNYLHSIYK